MKSVEKAEEKALEVCPFCGSKIEKGYVAFGSGLAWCNKKLRSWSLKGLFGGELIVGSGLGPHIYSVVAYRCKKCKLVIFRYGEANNSTKCQP